MGKKTITSTRIPWNRTEMSVYTVLEKGSAIENMVRYDHDIQAHINHLIYLAKVNGGVVELDLTQLKKLIEQHFKEEVIEMTWRTQ